MSIPRDPLRCTRCQTVLQGGLDTFGDPSEEICAECWYEEIEADDSFDHYGMAPHHHDFSITGGWIGSTVLEELPAPDEYGVIALPDGRFFVPDVEVEGAAGTYCRKHPSKGQSQ